MQTYFLLSTKFKRGRRLCYPIEKLSTSCSLFGIMAGHFVRHKKNRYEPFVAKRRVLRAEKNLFKYFASFKSRFRIKGSIHVLYASYLIKDLFFSYHYDRITSMGIF